ncbi:MAG: TonB-dependent receptor [Balneolaceae bacterium]
MMNKIRLLITGCLFLVLGTAGVIQGQTVTGTVTDAVSGETLPGVNVVVVGQPDIGTITTLDGTYELDVPSLDVELQYSYVGFEAQTIAVEGRSEIDVALSVQVIGGAEVVVVGYGTQTRETLSGSVSSVSGERMERVPVSNMANALTGQLPGLITVNESGQPGADGATLRIRGNSTLNNNSPLIVIDGVPDRSGGLDRINPRDIESISVLKDASAAIYGSRAANGVILITTKRGQTGAPQFNLDINQGFNQPTRVPEMADAATYMTMLNEIDNYAGLGDRFTAEEIQCHADGSDLWNCPDTDWFNEALKPASYQTRADFSVSGGSEDFRYRLSFNGLTEDGYFRNSSTRYNEYSFRSNLDGELSDYIGLSFDVLGRYEDRRNPTSSVTETFRMLMRGKPHEHAFWPNGLPAPEVENGVNPVVTGTDATGYHKDGRYYFQTRLSLDVEIPSVEGLSFTGTANYDKDFQLQKRWHTPWTLYDWTGFDSNGDRTFHSSVTPQQDAELRQWSDENYDVLLNVVGRYEQDLENHSFAILLGAERQISESEGFTAYRRFFPTMQIEHLDMGGEEQQSIGGSGNETARLNFFSRINYNYQSKYMVEAIARYDGSYIFPKGERFGFFPSLSVAWRLTQEDWFSNATDFFDELKLRASLGQTGNDRIEPWQFLNTYSFGGGYIFDVNNIRQSISPGRTPNPNVTWEVANQFNTGIEATILNNRVSLEVDYFNERRTDILWWRNASVPNSSGIDLPRENIGEVKSYGFDGNISWRNQLTNNLMLDVSLNGGYATNEIVFWDEPAGAPDHQQSTGRMMESPLVYDAIGVFRDQAHVESMPSFPGARAGDLIFRDVNGDGIIDADDRIRDERTEIPTWSGGLNISGQYKAFDFTLLFQGAAGAAQNIRTESGDFGNYMQDFAENRWTPDNPDASGPRAFQRTQEYWIANQNTYFRRSTDYIRLKNVEVGYNLPANIASGVGLQRLRVYANGFNLLTFSDFPMDPEAREGRGAYYPQKRIFNLGLSMSF